MLFSGSTEYAIRAVTHLAQLAPGTLAGARDISRAANIPMPFLSKILQKLRRQKLVRSFKGQKGGYELARPAGEITMQDLIIATGGEELEGRCALGLTQCDENQPCPMHDYWKGIRAQLQALYQQTTIADLSRAANTKRDGQ